MPAGCLFLIGADTVLNIILKKLGDWKFDVLSLFLDGEMPLLKILYTIPVIGKRSLNKFCS